MLIFKVIPGSFVASYPDVLLLKADILFHNSGVWDFENTSSF